MKKALTIHSLIGSVKSGKSTAVDAYPPDWVKVRPGRILRDMVGVEAMAQSQAPNAPPEVDAIVWSVVTSAIDYAIDQERPLLLDGYPRNVDQFSRFMSLLMDQPGDVELFVLFKTFRSVHPNAELDEFDKQRLLTSLSTTAKLERKIVSAAKSVRWLDMEVSE